MTKSQGDFTFSEKICLGLNRLFKPSKDLEIMRNNPTEEGIIEHSYKAGINHFKESLNCIDYKVSMKKDILDLGCGYGGLVSVLSEENSGMSVGIDLDYIALNSARIFINKKKSDKKKIYLILGDAESLPFTSRKFDLIYMVATMEHLSNPSKVLKECYRVLRKNGAIYIRFAPYYAFNGAHLFDFIHIPWCHLFFSEKTLLKAWKKLSFKDPELAKLNRTVDMQRDSLVGLNKITLKKFKSIVRESGFIVIKYEEKSFNRWYFRMFQKIFFLKEMLTNEIIATLVK